jgi:predicted nucleic-acid-binding Zn-ribbon protein
VRTRLDRAQSGGDDDRMRLPWQPSEYVRTCSECGYTWQVPRWAARRRLGTISAWSVAGGGKFVNRSELRTEVAAIQLQNQQADTYRVCPHCGAETFAQQPLRVSPTDPSPPR